MEAKEYCFSFTPIRVFCSVQLCVWLPADMNAAAIKPFRRRLFLCCSDKISDEQEISG